MSWLGYIGIGLGMGLWDLGNIRHQRQWEGRELPPWLRDPFAEALGDLGLQLLLWPLVLLWTLVAGGRELWDRAMGRIPPKEDAP